MLTSVEEMVHCELECYNQYMNVCPNSLMLMHSINITRLAIETLWSTVCLSRHHDASQLAMPVHWVSLEYIQ